MKRNHKKTATLLHFGLFIILIRLSACGDAVYVPSETGSIAFSVEWQGAPQESSGRYAAAVDCDAADVATVVVEVYDESSLYLTSGGPWLCSAHTGTIQNVSVGPDRTAVVLGKDINGGVLYRGEKSGIIVRAGQTTDAGTIVVELFSPALNPPVLISPREEETVTSGSFRFEWNVTTGALQYQIQVSTDTNFTSTVIDETVTTIYYTPTTTLSAGTYYWRLRAEDSYGKQSAWSVAWSFIIATEPGDAPSAPIGVTPTAGDQENTISWDSVSGATSYNIYWSTSSGATIATGTKRSNVTSPYTHTDLTNGTTYYYVLTAENRYGESDESDEVSATPSATGTAPSAPTNVNATAGHEEITVSWDTAPGATSYSIYWSTNSGVSKSDYEGKIEDITTTSYTHSDLTNGTTYYYVLTAENSYGESDESNEVSATPGLEISIIIVDGMPGDWSGIEPVMSDAQGDSSCGIGTDLRKVYLAQDNNYLYWRVDTWSGTYEFESGDFDRGPGVVFYSISEQGEILRGVEAHMVGSSEQGSIATRDYGSDWVWFDAGPQYGKADQVAEGKIPLSLFEGYEFNSLLAWYHTGISNVLCDEVHRWGELPIP